MGRSALDKEGCFRDGGKRLAYIQVFIVLWKDITLEEMAFSFG